MAPTDYQQQVMAAIAECGDTVRDGAIDAVKMWIKNDDDKTKTVGPDPYFRQYRRK